MGELPNLIVIILDTLRKDYDIPVRNVLEKFGFVSYERAIAPAPWTVPSHASMLTGLYPALHGAHETKKRKIPSVKLDKKDNLLTFKLKEFGYDTVLLTSNFFVHPHFGFVGFDNVYYVPPLPEIKLLSDSERQILRKIVQNQSNFRRIFLELVRKNHYRLLLKGGTQYLMQTFYKHFLPCLSIGRLKKGYHKLYLT
ncbi:sulfatase-like hydrolase/transferase [Thermococcus sp.]|uniref:sulfatase-like hydrolase/transferase n=1 Tax=Thermococcus sp. TaxID=35749 RepID=UPI00261F5858|nr:sulfatase-like hydrolase/transferase [Thermococcus sp.]